MDELQTISCKNAAADISEVVVEIFFIIKRYDNGI
jgi:hypothetical protein